MMASAVYSEPPASRLSIALEGEASASPFPSPSSSFLPPPTPGAHEFAVKPAPSARNGRKLSTTAYTATNGDSGKSDTSSQRSNAEEASPAVNGQLQPPILIAKDALAPPLSPSLISPTTPTPYSLQKQPAPLMTLEPPRSPVAEQSTSSATTPTIQTAALPAEDYDMSREPEEDHQLATILIPSGLDGAFANSNSPTSPAFSTFSTSSRRSRPLSASLASSRPAPASPVASRRVSGVPSIAASTRSRASRPPSQTVSRTNSLRMSRGGGSAAAASASPVLHPHRLSQSVLPPLSPQHAAFALSVQPPLGGSAEASSSSRPMSRAVPPVFIKVRDFGFPASDARHDGLGPDVPRPNVVRRLNRRLAPASLRYSGASAESSGAEEDDDDAEDEDGWDSSELLGRLKFPNPGGATEVWDDYDAEEAADREGLPSHSELDMNFAAEEEEEEEPLYPGIYRALYAFEPEGIAEMRLEEDQLVRVVGRGGGVGWAVVIDESAVPTPEEVAEAEKTGGVVPVRHALVPEGYLEAVRYDGEPADIPMEIDHDEGEGEKEMREAGVVVAA